MLTRLQAALTRRPALTVLTITGVGAALRLFHLGFKSLWYDEAVLYWIAQPAGGSWSDVLAQNAAQNSAPPLFALLLAGLVRHAPATEAVLRAVACAAGIAAIPAMYRLAREFVSVPAAATAALLVAVAPTQLLYAQQVREYGPAFLLAILLLHAYVRYTRRPPPSWRAGTGLALLLVVGVFTQYGLAVLIAGVNVAFFWELVRRRDGEAGARARSLPAWLGIQAVGLAAVLVVYATALREQLRAARGASYLVEAYWGGSALSLLKMPIRNTYDLVLFAFPSDLALLLALIGVAEAVRLRRERPILPLVVGPVAVCLLLAVARLYPYGGVRQALFLTPLVYLSCAIGVERLARSGGAALAAAWVALLAGLGVYHSARYLRDPNPEHVRPAIEALVGAWRDGDRIFVTPRAVPAARYYLRDGGKPWIAGRGSRAEYQEQLREALRQRGRVWIVFTHFDPAENTADIVLPLAGESGGGRAMRRVYGAAGAEVYLAESPAP